MGRFRRPGSFMKKAPRMRYAAVFLALASLSAQQPTFKVDVPLVRLLVTVKNAAGDLVGSLNRADFTVQDEGVPQDIAVFDRQTAQALSVTLLVDTSASTGKDLKYEITSITKFLNALVQEGNPDDSVSLYTFNWQ